jgi:hypothetical protein
MSEVQVQLAAGAPTPVITLFNQTANAGQPATDPIEIVLQPFMKGIDGTDGVDGVDGKDGSDGLNGSTGPQGPQGDTPVISISVHAISAAAQPTVAAGGTPLAPTFDIGIPSGASFNVDEFVAQSAGAITRVYAFAPSASTKVFINGLRQSSSGFTVTGNEVELPDSLSIEAGDLIQIEY